MEDIIKSLEERSILIKKNEIPKEKFNDFAINFYLDTKKILISLNKFLTARNLKSPKILQVKNAGELLYLSQDNQKILNFLKENSYESIPELNTKIAYYVIKKNQYTLEENWKNILEVLNKGANASTIINERKKQLSKEQKIELKKQIMSNLNLEEHEIDWILSKLNELKENDAKLFEKFNLLV